MDMAETIAPKSDQLNADDLISGPVTVTVVRVSKGSPEQPVNVELDEYPGRPFRPSKSMRRVLVAVWGRKSEAYVGRRLRLYRDPEVTFGRDKVGGIRISHMEGLTESTTVMLTVKRGRREPYTVDPLPTTTAAPTVADVEACDDIDALRAMWATADATVQDAIRARVALLQGGGAA